MTEAKITLIVFAVVALFLIGSYISNPLESPYVLPLSHIDLFGITILCFWIAYRIRRQVVSEHATEQIQDFIYFFFLMGLFFLFLAAPGITLLPYPDSYGPAAAWGYRLAHIFLYIAIAYFVRIPLSWYKPSLKNAASIAAIVLGIIATGIALRSAIQITLLESGITIWNPDPLLGFLIIAISLLGWVPAGAYFIYKAISFDERVNRIRSLLLGIGILLMVAGGPFHNITQDSLVIFIGDLILLVGTAVIALGVFYRHNAPHQHIIHA